MVGTANGTAEALSESERHRVADFREQLLDLAQRDVARAEADPNDYAARSVALWMASEIERHAVEDRLSAEESRTLCQQARALRQRVQEAGLRRAA